MRRCKPWLGTFVEITINDPYSLHQLESASRAVDAAFAAIALIQHLMGFHQEDSELSHINQTAHLHPINLHPWTAQVLIAAQEVHQHSNGAFNCGIGHRLVAAGLLPQHPGVRAHQFGGIEDLRFLEPNRVFSTRPVCLDLGGIAKGFAVDQAVQVLKNNGIKSGMVNAGGDLKVFGKHSQVIYLRDPRQPNHLTEIGELKEGAIATSSLYFAKQDHYRPSFIINPFASPTNNPYIEFSESYSVVAPDCLYADALTKVLILSTGKIPSCFSHFSAQAIALST